MIKQIIGVIFSIGCGVAIGLALSQYEQKKEDKQQANYSLLIKQETQKQAEKYHNDLNDSKRVFVSGYKMGILSGIKLINQAKLKSVTENDINVAIIIDSLKFSNILDEEIRKLQ